MGGQPRRATECTVCIVRSVEPRGLCKHAFFLAVNEEEEGLRVRWLERGGAGWGGAV